MALTEKLRFLIYKENNIIRKIKEIKHKFEFDQSFSQFLLDIKRFFLFFFLFLHKIFYFYTNIYDEHYENKGKYTVCHYINCFLLFFITFHKLFIADDYDDDYEDG